MNSIRKRIIVNTMKISAAAILAIALATSMNLDYAISAGTVAILTILPTKRETIKTAFGRLLAFICALIIAFVCYGLLGYTLWGFYVFLSLYVLVCQMAGWYSSMAINSVLISHFLTAGSMDLHALFNEGRIFLIGMSIGVIANLHLRKNVNYIEELKESTDNQIKMILNRIAERVLDKDALQDSRDCFVELKDSIRKAKNVADMNYNNQLRGRDDYDIEYIRMRDRQCQVLYEMYKNVHQIHTTPITAEKIASFLREMSVTYHKTNTGEELLEHFREMDESMKSKPLPTERVEFEDRARLFNLLRHIEEFILIKVEFAEKFNTRRLK